MGRKGEREAKGRGAIERGLKEERDE